MNYKTGDKAERTKEKATEKADVYDSIYTQLRTESGIQKVQPEKKIVSDKDRA